MSEMAEYYDDGLEEELEKFEPGNRTFFIVVGEAGELYAIMGGYEEAWQLANRVNGWLGETMFAKPVDFREKLGHAVGAAIEDFISGKTPGVRRERPMRKPDIEANESATPLDQPNAP